MSNVSLDIWELASVTEHPWAAARRFSGHPGRGLRAGTRPT
jgi:hypothetical protein